ncbi:MAG TPA: TIR domain-containing protein [Solirubrobacteraceae bacterium]|nr:TIR domain-containing protein [Solirubrobacteraceae bacterium]
MDNKPAVFIGSSSEGIEIARAIQFQLRDDALATIWDEGVFGLGRGTLESLVTMLDRYDFAVLVITPDDVVSSRDVEAQAPRDNVMFELGLFMGRLGRARTFAVCSNAKDLKLPSDLAGVTFAQFDDADARKELSSALGPACFQLRQAIRELGQSEQKRLHGIHEAASEVEGLSERMAHLLALLVRSRILELEVISTQFGPMLPADFVEELERDLRDLEAATKRTPDST